MPAGLESPTGVDLLLGRGLRFNRHLFFLVFNLLLGSIPVDCIPVKQDQTQGNKCGRVNGVFELGGPNRLNPPKFHSSVPNERNYHIQNHTENEQQHPRTLTTLVFNSPKAALFCTFFFSQNTPLSVHYRCESLRSNERNYY